MIKIKFLQQIASNYGTFTSGIANLWKWKKIIWNDRWWDHDYFYEMMLFKLKDMESHWGSDTNGENDKDVKLILQSLIDDLEMLKEDDFVRNEHEEIDLKYGKVDFIREKKDDGRSILILKREKETPNNREEIHKRIIEVYTLENERRTQTKQRFFDTFRDNIETFWD